MCTFFVIVICDDHGIEGIRYKMNWYDDFIFMRLMGVKLDSSITF